MLTIEQQTKPIEAETDTEGDGGLLFYQIWIVSLENDQSVDDAGDCAPKRDIPYSSFSSKGLWIFLPLLANMTKLFKSAFLCSCVSSDFTPPPRHLTYF